MNGPVIEPERQPATVADRLAREIKRLRLESGLSQRILATKIGYSRQYVSMAEWEDANLPSQELVSAIDAALGANGALTALRARAKTDQQSTRTVVNPDHPLRGTITATTKDTAPKEDCSPTHHSQGTTDELINVLGRIHKLNRSIDPDIIEHLADSTRLTIEQYETIDSSSLVGGLVKQRAWIDELLDECSRPQQRQQLFEIAGQTSGLLGFITASLGNFPLSRAYCLEAFQLGDFVDDMNLQAWARGLQSFCEYYAGRYDEALRYAQDGLNYAKSGPQSVRLTINGAARALGKLGDTNGVRRAVDESYALMEQNNAPNGAPSSISLGCYSAAQVAGNAATAYLSLAMPDRVEEYVNRALPEMSASDSPWGRSLVIIDMARSQILSEQADLEHATALMVDALDISSGNPMIPVRRRAAEFAQDLAARWGSSPQLGVVRDALASLRGTDGQS
ncbi:helix-turn-helix transcriptional regulator [Nocardia sp. NBC_00565]|uniref:helix-turn-helix transcriptional regulator n=1 Tax=Nocardia sp. NBC_00565 TaxID=2975993 RepID=UPI002E803579|nr:helix-turn-helix transcriptional regulator [Nocardia sp. NBC_00565]WUC00296.1 helix-turn-helix transcriptional regulator [Nocardia sp. NBC_00565]